MQHGKNKVCVRYDIVNTNDTDAYFSIVPFVNYRNFHAVSNAIAYEQSYGDDDILTVNTNNKYKLYMSVNDSKYTEYYNTFYNNMFYRVEKSRGFDAKESQCMIGEFKVEIPKKTTKTFLFVAELSEKCSINPADSALIIKNEETRLDKICKMAYAKTRVERELAVSADQFIISKGKNKSIVAGYPWFSDWGRDTFISLEGLTLKTNRFTDAKNILKYFANNIRRGIVPNYIDEKGGGSYNTVDASLWYIEAINRYVKYTNDYGTLRELFPRMLEIVYSYMTGTDYSIYMDDDGLISAGTKDTQLTWMDAKVGDYIPTPRFGKTVEVNSLWYNALKVCEKLNVTLLKKYAPNISEKAMAKEKLDAIYELDSNDDDTSFNENKTRNLFLADKAIRFYEALTIVFDGRLSKRVKESFKKFYNDDGLFDTIEPFSKQIRPNQIISLSLSYPVLSGDKAVEVFKLVKQKLYTSKGLKTLSSDDEQYCGRYEGDSFSRDSSYHQGTVWPWLIGEYASAYKQLYKKDFVCTTMEELLDDGCVGSVAEIYDADEPRYPNGALAQAWSVSALITILFD